MPGMPGVAGRGPARKRLDIGSFVFQVPLVKMVLIFWLHSVPVSQLVALQNTPGSSGKVALLGSYIPPLT